MLISKLLGYFIFVTVSALNWEITQGVVENAPYTIPAGYLMIQNRSYLSIWNNRVTTFSDRLDIEPSSGFFVTTDHPVRSFIVTMVGTILNGGTFSLFASQIPNTPIFDLMYITCIILGCYSLLPNSRGIHRK